MFIVQATGCSIRYPLTPTPTPTPTRSRALSIKHFFTVTNGTTRFFVFSLIIEGTAEKVLQFIMPFKSIYNRNFGYVEQNMYFLTIQGVSSKKNCIN